MDIQNISANLSSVAKIINSRPLGLSSQQKDVFRPITPGDLLTSRSAKSHSELETNMELLDETQEATYLEAMKSEKLAIFGAWKAKWLASVFPTLVQRAKWKLPSSNLAPGQVGMLKYQSKYGADSFKLARVTQVFPEEGDLVRTVEVEIGVTQGSVSRPKHRLIIPTNRFCPLENVQSVPGHTN